MSLCRLNKGSTLLVPGNNGHRYEASYQGRSRCSHLNGEQMDFRALGHQYARLSQEHTDFRGRDSRCSHLSREQREQVTKLRSYVFPLFPGTGEGITRL